VFGHPLMHCVQDNCHKDLLKSEKASIDLDCSAAKCPEECECSTTACAGAITDCLGDAECAKVQPCVFQCECGDIDCFHACVDEAESKGDVFGHPLMHCVQDNCHKDLLKSEKASIDLDCSAAKCPEECECSTASCAGAISDCLGDVECAKVQPCVFQCECGDIDCFHACVDESEAKGDVFGHPLMHCVHDNCHKELLKSTEKEADEVDCSAATCSKTCECSLSECPTEAAACLGDPECTKIQACVFQCPCGDEACGLACLEQTFSPSALPLFQCAQDKCSDTMLHASAGADIDCDTASCPETCACSLSQCKAAVNDCLNDAECAKQHDCAFKCGCGDEECLLQCVESSESPFAASLLECVKGNCKTDFRNANIGSVDCEAASCKEACQCSMDKCASSVNACLADADCAKVQDCAMGCSCGDDECLLACAKETTSPLGISVAECIASNCHVAARALLGAPNLSCKGSACEASCHCAKSRCLGVGMACLLDPQCSEFQSCSFNCACGDADCAIQCANERSSAKAMPLAKCITQRCHSEEHI